MPIIKSAKKRVRVARKATIRNAKTKRSLRVAVKSFQKSLSTDKKNATELQHKAQSELDKAGKKHVMHKNKVARKQRQLAAAAKAAGVAITTVKKTSPSVKKPAVKATTPAKKPVVAKKPAAKKASVKK
jgi:small subunit ribosomal protein S20